MIQIFTLMEDEKLSMHQICEKLKLSKSQYYRRKKNLKLLGLSENYVNMVKPVDVKFDFSTYYFKTSGLKYQEKFFFKNEYTKIS